MMRLKLKNDEFNDAWGIFFIFLAGVLVYFFLGDVHRITRVYGDELLYHGLARSFFNGTGFMLRNVRHLNSKIGYPLLLTPFFAISDVFLRVKLIGLLNSVVMMLSIIPAWLIGKEIGLDRKNRYYLVFLTAIWPDMMFSLHFLAEVLVWPIFLTLIYLWLLNQRQESYKNAIAEGFLFYLAYLVKRTLFPLLLAYAAFEIVYPFLEYRLSRGSSNSQNSSNISDVSLSDGKKSRKKAEQKTALKLRDFYRKKKFILLLIIIAIFVLCHITMRVTVLHSAGTVNAAVRKSAQAAPVLYQLYKFGYKAYSIFYYLAALLAATLLFPFIYPAVHFKSMSEGGRKLFCCTVLYFLIMLAAVVIVHVEPGKMIPRVHLRYFGPAFILLLASFFDCMQGLTQDAVLKRRRIALTLLALAGVFVFSIFKWDRVYAVDNQTLKWFSMLFGAKWQLAVKGQEKVIYFGALIANFLVLSIAGIFYYLCTHKGIKRAVKFSVLAFVIVCLANDTATYLSYRAYYGRSSHEPTLKEVIAIDDYFKGRENANILYITQGRASREIRFVDVYMRPLPHVYYVQHTLIASKKVTGDLEVAGTKFQEARTGKLYENVKDIEYIIVENPILKLKQFANVERIDAISGEYFTVYKNLDPSMIKFKPAEKQDPKQSQKQSPKDNKDK